MPLGTGYQNKTHIDPNKIDIGKISSSQSNAMNDSYVKISEKNAVWKSDDLSYKLLDDGDGDTSNDVAVIYNGDTAIGFTKAENLDGVVEEVETLDAEVEESPIHYTTEAEAREQAAQNAKETEAMDTTGAHDAVEEAKETVEEAATTASDMQPEEEIPDPPITAETVNSDGVIPAVHYKTDSNGHPIPLSPSENGQSLVDYAMQFEGNDYVYGGTSLTNGTDCSGFVMLLYKEYGIELPHSANAIRKCGKEVTLEEAQPGDVICWDGHVAIYIGDGKIIQALNEKKGIEVRSLDNVSEPILSIRRIF